MDPYLGWASARSGSSRARTQTVSLTRCYWELSSVRLRMRHESSPWNVQAFLCRPWILRGFSWFDVLILFTSSRGRGIIIERNSNFIAFAVWGFGHSTASALTLDALVYCSGFDRIAILSCHVNEEHWYGQFEYLFALHFSPPTTSKSLHWRGDFWCGMCTFGYRTPSDTWRIHPHHTPGESIVETLNWVSAPILRILMTPSLDAPRVSGQRIYSSLDDCNAP